MSAFLSTKSFKNSRISVLGSFCRPFATIFLNSFKSGKLESTVLLPPGCDDAGGTDVVAGFAGAAALPFWVFRLPEDCSIFTPHAQQ